MIIRTHRGSNNAAPAKAPVKPTPVAPKTAEPQPKKKINKPLPKKEEPVVLPIEEEVSIEEFLKKEEE